MQNDILRRNLALTLSRLCDNCPNEILTLAQHSCNQKRKVNRSEDSDRTEFRTHRRILRDFGKNLKVKNPALPRGVSAKEFS